MQCFICFLSPFSFHSFPQYKQLTNSVSVSTSSFVSKFNSFSPSEVLKISRSSQKGDTPLFSQSTVHRNTGRYISRLYLSKHILIQCQYQLTLFHTVFFSVAPGRGGVHVGVSEPNLFSQSKLYIFQMLIFVLIHYYLPDDGSQRLMRNQVPSIRCV